jgi:hypothetical protein
MYVAFAARGFIAILPRPPPRRNSLTARPERGTAPLLWSPLNNNAWPVLLAPAKPTGSPAKQKQRGLTP